MDTNDKIRLLLVQLTNIRAAKRDLSNKEVDLNNKLIRLKEMHSKEIHEEEMRKVCIIEELYLDLYNSKQRNVRQI